MALGSNNNSGWKATKEKVLLTAGLSLIGFSAAVSVFASAAFRYELVIAGLALCGVGLAQWGDRGGSK
jgi:hypothetical protein